MTLAKLIEAVEAGIATGGPADALVVPKEQSDLIASVLGDDDELWSDFVEAHDGSLDAAKRLHDALLQGWSFGVGDTRAGVYTEKGIFPNRLRTEILPALGFSASSARWNRRGGDG